MGETGDGKGIDEAIVPPTPVLDVGAVILSGAHFPVMEQVVGVIVVVGVTTVGLFTLGSYGDPIAMTKGMLLPDPVLSFRGGEEGAMLVILE